MSPIGCLLKHRFVSESLVKDEKCWPNTKPKLSVSSSTSSTSSLCGSRHVFNKFSASFSLTASFDKREVAARCFHFAIVVRSADEARLKVAVGSGVFSVGFVV